MSDNQNRIFLRIPARHRNDMKEPTTLRRSARLRGTRGQPVPPPPSRRTRRTSPTVQPMPRQRTRHDSRDDQPQPTFDSALKGTVARIPKNESQRGPIMLRIPGRPPPVTHAIDPPPPATSSNSDVADPPYISRFLIRTRPVCLVIALPPAEPTVEDVRHPVHAWANNPRRRANHGPQLLDEDEKRRHRLECRISEQRDGRHRIFEEGRRKHQEALEDYVLQRELRVMRKQEWKGKWDNSGASCLISLTLCVS